MKKSSQLIWILEDDPGCLFVYEEVLSLRYRVEFFTNLTAFSQALKTVASQQCPDLIIADLRLPDGNFVDYFLRQDSAPSLKAPFIIVSSTDDLDVLRLCFQEGVMDYLTKPFSKTLLVAKVEQLLMGRKDVADGLGSGWSAIELDPVALEIRTRSGAPVKLTARELQIFTLLTRAKGQPLDRRAIFRAVWGDTSVVKKTLDVHLFNLRRKLEGLGFEICHRPPSSFYLTQKMG